MSIKVTNRFPKFRSEVEKRASQFVNGASTIGANSSKYYAPLAYSTLINSQQISLTVNGNVISGTVGFYTEYAKHLEVNKNWKPKPPPKYGNKKKGIPPANAWNQNARPGFLSYGFENEESKRNIEQLRKVFKV